MSKRLQVLFDEAELRDLRETARREEVPLSEWVRRAFERLVGVSPGGNIDSKLRAVRAAARYEFPTADIAEMLTEIERGYATSVPE